MSENRDVIIIGGGGIGSYFCHYLYRYAKYYNPDQFSSIIEHTYLYDFDSVDKSNLRHQNFMPNEVGVPKALVLALNYSNLSPKVKRFCKEDLYGFGNPVFIICADNSAVRTLIYTNCYKEHIEFLDMRSEGDRFAIVTNLADKETAMSSLGTNRDSTEGRSCQLSTDTDMGIIKSGNILVPTLGISILVDILNGTNKIKSIVGSVKEGFVTNVVCGAKRNAI